MVKLRILISDGNTLSDRAAYEKFNGRAPSGLFAQLLKRLRSEIETEIAYPADPDPIRRFPLEAYDGILFTGSSSNIYKRERQTMRQIEFARAAFGSGTPMFGVCWGLQLATVAAGGDVAASRAATCACEVPFASDIRLTKEGRSHPMHQSRRDAFDAFSFHSDEVICLPRDAVVTARNRHFIQAAEIRSSKSTFWGVQYHPELSGVDMAGFLRACQNELVSSGQYESGETVEEAAKALAHFEEGAEIPDKIVSHFNSIRTDSFEFSPLEITNWIERMVIPFAMQR